MACAGYYGGSDADAFEPVAKRFKGGGASAKGCGKGAKSSGDPREEGEVRFFAPDSAQRAVQLLDGSALLGHNISVALDSQSSDATKVVVTNMPPGLAWQELKDHFGQAGQVHYANIGRTDEKGKGKGADAGASVAAKGYGKAPRATGDPNEEGEVRFYSAECAQFAIQNLDKSTLMGQEISVSLDPKSQDQTKILIRNMPVGLAWQHLKDHFSQAGEIHFANIGRTADNGKGKGFGVAQAGQPCVGEVRFTTREEAMQAIDLFNNKPFKDGKLEVRQDLSSKAGTKVLVLHVPVGTDCTELKEVFDKAGQIEFCGIDCAKGCKGKGKNAQYWDMGGYDAYDYQAYDPGAHGFAGQHYGFTDTGMAGPEQSGASPNVVVGEVRYSDAKHAQAAIDQLNGSRLGNTVVKVVLDRMCKDNTRVMALGLEEGTSWQALKDHFAGIGPVAFSGLKINGVPAHKYYDQQVLHHAADGSTAQQYHSVAAPPGADPNAHLPPIVGEVRYGDAATAERAVRQFNGIRLGSSVISVVVDRMCRDGSRLLVMGLSPGTSWRDLKDRFAQVGPVAYAGVKPTGAPAGGVAYDFDPREFGGAHDFDPREVGVAAVEGSMAYGYDLDAMAWSMSQAAASYGYGSKSQALRHPHWDYGDHAYGGYGAAGCYPADGFAARRGDSYGLAPAYGVV